MSEEAQYLRIKYITRSIDYCPLRVKKEIGKMILDSGVKLHDHAGGCVVKFDSLSPELISKIHLLVSECLNEEIKV